MRHGPNPPSFIGNNQNLLLLIEQLDLAISLHIGWLKVFHLNLVCGKSPDGTGDVAVNAHERCAFGKWFYHEGRAALDAYEATGSIESVHREMHDAARDLLRGKRDDGTLCGDGYARFIDLANSFKGQMRALQNDVIKRVCSVDQLTGAWNRYEMYHRLGQEMERIRRKGGSCTLVMMDIDYFKRVNDDFGHNAGDRVLQQLIQHCVERLRTYDAVFRYGGEEFLLCLPGSTTTDAAGLVERLRESIRAQAFDIGDGRSTHITVSFGIATLAKGKEMEDTLLEADHALLCAKAEGRDRYCIWGA